MSAHTYLAIDLKSFYASVECRERGLDPLDTNLVVADERRTDKTICLAVTPSLKSYGISGRGRLFEVRQRVREANIGRRHDAPGHQLSGSSFSFSELQSNPSLAVDFIIAPPRMAYYMEYSNRIYSIYMKYVAPEDIVVYSIDEVFMDVTGYLNTYGLTAHELAMKIILDVLNTTGITATAGIGTNLFLCKVAMDIVAKHIPADRNGVRIAALDEMSFRRRLWSHQPITDFWRVGRGYAKKLEQHGMFTMGDVALCSERDEELLYRLFGKNAELLIDHAWGWEPCTIEAIKKLPPSLKSISSGQVLTCPYPGGQAARHRPDRAHRRLRHRKSDRPGAPSALSRQDRGRPLRPHAAQTGARLDQSRRLHRLHASDHGGSLRPVRPHCRPRAAHPAYVSRREPRAVRERRAAPERL